MINEASDGFTEHTINFEIAWDVFDNRNEYSYTDGVTLELHVHTNDELYSNITRVYGYRKEVSTLPKRFQGKVSKNPLFQDLSKEFIGEYIAELKEAVSDSLMDK